MLIDLNQAVFVRSYLYYLAHIYFLIFNNVHLCECAWVQVRVSRVLNPCTYVFFCLETYSLRAIMQ